MFGPWIKRTALLKGFIRSANKTNMARVSLLVEVLSRSPGRVLFSPNAGMDHGVDPPPHGSSSRCVNLVANALVHLRQPSLLTARPSGLTDSGSIRLMWYKLGQKMPSKVPARDVESGVLTASCVALLAGRGGGVSGTPSAGREFGSLRRSPISSRASLFDRRAMCASNQTPSSTFRSNLVFCGRVWSALVDEGMKC